LAAKAWLPRLAAKNGNAPNLPLPIVGSHCRR
jgi:hypothetical protein